MADLALPLVPLASKTTSPNKVNLNPIPPPAGPPNANGDLDTLKDDELVKAFHAVDKDGSGQIMINGRTITDYLILLNSKNG